MHSKSQQFVFFTPNLTITTVANKVRSISNLKLSGRQFEVGDKANFVRNIHNGQIRSVKHELLRFAVQILSPTFNSLQDC